MRKPLFILIVVGVITVVVATFCSIDYFGAGRASIINANTVLRCENEDYPGYDAVVLDPVPSRLKKLGGLGHWYHWAETILPGLHESYKKSWNHRMRRSAKKLLVVFQDKYAVSQLGPFGRMMLLIVLSGGTYDQVVLGYANIITYAHEKSHFAGLQGFERQFGIDFLTQPRHELFVVDALHVNIGSAQRLFTSLRTGSTKAPASVCVRVAHKLRWDAFHKTNWFTHVENMTMINTAVDNMCRFDPNKKRGAEVLPDATSMLHPPLHESTVADDITVSMRKWQRRKTPPLKTYQRPPVQSSDSPHRVLMYQRDFYRGLYGVDDVANKIVKLLNPNAEQSDLRGPGTASPVQSARTAGTADWAVETMVHNNLHSPCRLVDKIRKADVLFTSHGFQSVLMLFQPAKSVLVEVFPHWFYKPFVFGSVQASLRSIGFHHRYYLQSESKPSFIMSLVQMLVPVYNRDSCLDEYAGTCGALSRTQNVYVSDDFLHHLTDFLKIQYIIR